MGQHHTEVIDIMPRMLKSAEGRKLVQQANDKLTEAIAGVAHSVVLNLDDMEMESGMERQSAFAAVKLAIARWHDAGSNFAFTLGGINPETRERYSFSDDMPRLSDMDRLQLVGMKLYPLTWPRMTPQEQATQIEKWMPIYRAVRSIVED